jgi:CubicO group peptidase (beta-lactamase class C family)
MDYLSYMQKKVFTPLGMTETCADYSDSIVPNRVRFYELGIAGIVNASLVDNSYKWAGGGLLSTPVDLVKLAMGIYNRTLFGKETVSTLFNPQLLANGDNTHYGFGWRTGVGSQGKKIVHHGGLIDGGRTFLLLYPDDEITVAITANISGARINIPEAETIANFFFDIKP